MAPVRILVLGTGRMAGAHVSAFRADPNAQVVAAVDVVPERARAFCDRHGIARSFGDLSAAIAWGEFDAASNVTPDPVHHPTTMALLAAGKHVLCEKPLAESFPLADAMARAAEAAGLVNMVNLTFRNVPALQKARALVAAGEIGQVRHVEASYRQSWLVANYWGDWRASDTWLWRLSERHGSKGVLGDIGIHILDFATYAVGLRPVSLQARLQTFQKAPGNRIGEYVLDANDSAVMSLEFENGALGVVQASRFMSGYSNTLSLAVFGTEGSLEIDHSLAHSTLRMCAGDAVHRQAWHDVVSDPVPTNYQTFLAAVRRGVNDEPSFRHAADLQRVLDLCFEAGGATLRVPA
jgi:predicted dehydrogenase